MTESSAHRAGPDDSADLLVVEGLTVTFPTTRGPVDVVRENTFTLRPNETLGIVGESGSGKSMTALAVMGLLPRSARTSGSIRFRGTELLGRPDAELRRLRGNVMSMVFQDPLSSLNPYYTVGLQISEVYQCHRGGSRRAARRMAIAPGGRGGRPRPAPGGGARPPPLSAGGP
ncbi:ATP-binding cassette domain-containing protein, partial [Streptomyces sp. NPDC059590]|uniref:ATP-binding cassette domain-containing protein n=1 Tax=Streptomyces sp. NPDC059590 TaxID=3346877 RepID=UPI0036A8B46B